MLGHYYVMAQDVAPEPKKEKKNDQYFGVQANQLLRQLLNFGGTSPTVNNPYLMVYSLNSKTTGFGLSLGLGYNYNQSRSGDGFSNTISTLNDFSFRFGLEDKTWFAKRWMASWGVDLVFDSDKSKTVASSAGGTQPITTETKLSGSGVGPRITLNFLAHEKIVIGTEASYYLKFMNQSQTITGTNITPLPDAKLRSLQFSLPAAIFVMLKF